MRVGQIIGKLKAVVLRVNPGIGNTGRITESEPAARTGNGHWIIEVALDKHMQVMRTHIADTEYRILEELALDVQVPLHLIRRGMDAEVISIRNAQTSVGGNSNRIAAWAEVREQQGIRETLGRGLRRREKRGL